MSLSRVVVLDCGASRVALGAFSKSGNGRMRIDDYAAEHFFIEPGRDEAWLDEVRAALQTLRTRWKAGGPVLLTLPGHLVLTKHIKTPRVETAQREKIIKFEAQQNIPYALHEVVWDHVVVGDTGIDMEVLLAAAKLDVVDELCAAVEAAGFTPRLLLPTPLATLAGFRLAHPKESQPAIVLNLGARSTTLLIAEANRFYVRSLSLGGSNVSQQIGADQDCEIQEAESLKLGGRNASLTAHAMESLAVRLAQEITRSVMHFRRQSGAESPVRVFLAGGGARLAGLSESLAGKVNVPVEIVDALSAVEISTRAGKSEVAEDALALTDLLGSAATQLFPNQAVVNLLPPRLRRREGRRRRQPWLMAAALLALAALGPVIWHFQNLANAAREKTAAIEAELAPLREREARNRINLQKLADARAVVARLQSVYSRRANWLGMFADLQERLVRVEDVWLENLQISAPPSDPAQGLDGPLRITISGRLLDKTNPLAKVSPDSYERVKTLLANIVDSPFVSDVENERFDNRQPGILQFDFVLVGQADHPL